MRFRLLFAALAVVCLTAASAQQTPPPALQAVKFEKPPVIDATIDTEKEWTGIPSVSGLVDAGSGREVPEGAQFWIGYDERFVYFAARVADSDPKGIQATEYRTNVGLTGDDFVQLDIDPTGSLGEFNTFQVNPRGATNVQLAGGRAAKREWSGEILAKGRVTETGWEVEARIPWQIMKLPGAGPRNVRFNFSRNIARSNRTLTHVFVQGGNLARTPYWNGVILPRPALDRSIKFLPYTYLGYDRDDGGVFNMGLDVKTSITDQVLAVGSINPDFRNIENQILSLDFSRFERLAGETRPFFQEGANYSGSQIFVPQRIPGFDVGLNTYGRLDAKTNFGLIEAVDFNAKFGPERGNRNNFVGTVTQQLDANTNLRASLTSLSRPGLSNEAYLLRASRDYGPLNVFLRTMGSKDTNAGIGQQHDFQLGYTQKDFFYFVGGAISQEGFNPRLGFVQETNYRGLNVGTNFNRIYPKGPFNDWGYSVQYTDNDRLNGDFYRRETSGSLFATLRSGLYGVVAYDNHNFEGSRDYLYTVQTGFPRGNPYRNINFSRDWGRQAGADYHSTGVNGAFRVANRLQLTGSFQAVDYQGYQDQTIVGWNYDLGSDRAISGRLVKRDDKTNAYFSFRKSGNRGAEYFLIVGDPNALTFRPSVILKLVVPFQIGR